MSTYEWLLLLHVLSAAGVVAALVVLAAVVLVGRGGGGPGEPAAFGSLARPTTTVFSVSGLAVLVLGIWLAFEADYGLDEPWIIAAIVLWLVAAGAGERAGRPYTPVREPAGTPAAGGEVATGAADVAARDRRAALLLVVAAASVLGMLVLMIFKPGA